MSDFTDAWETAFRAYVVDGVPGSGPNPPDKAEVRALGALIEALSPKKSETVTLVGAAHTLTLDHENQWLEVNHTDEVVVTVPPHADVALPEFCDIYGAQTGAGQVSFAGGSGVTILVDEESNPVTRSVGAVWQLRQIEVDTWRLFGALEAA